MEAAAGEHHASHEVLVTFGPLEAAVVDDDGLDGGQPVVDQQIGTLGQEPIVPAPVHRLDHLDRHQLVEPAGEVPPVLAEHRDAIGKAGVGYPLLDVGALGVGDGGGGHPAAVAGDGVDGQTAPARAYLDQVVGRRQLELGAQPVDLGLLCLGQGGGGALEHGARVGHGLVQHEGEEVVGEVVVLGDVPLVIVPVGGGQTGRNVEQRAQTRPSLSRRWRSGRVCRDRARTSPVRSSVSHQPATYDVPRPIEPERSREP